MLDHPMFEEPAVDQGLLSLRIPPVSASISINDRDRERGGIKKKESDEGVVLGGAGRLQLGRAAAGTGLRRGALRPPCGRRGPRRRRPPWGPSS